MNIVADERVDRGVVERLRQDVHQVWYVAEMEPGSPDDAVLDLATREGALPLTADIVATAVSQHPTDLVNGFTVITPGVCRTRRLRR